jgi:uncharacterized membrane protein YedE/YeeE
VFGWGLLISGMTQPSKVLAFLDLFGDWDPSLAVVMAAALAVTSAGFWLARRFRRPLLAPKRYWPDRADIDRPLVMGSILFGAGWGLVGLCPGPAIENLASPSAPLVAFVLAMVAGMVVHDRWREGSSEMFGPRRDSSVTAASDG